MSVVCAIADGNLTSSSTWGLIDSTSYLNAENGSEILTTAYSGTRSQTFTPGAITIDAIAVKLSVRTGTTGTMSVELAIAGVGVAGTEVTINCSDLPTAATADLNGGWVILKLAAPVLLVAATAYAIEAKTSNASQVSLFRDGTTDNISHFLRTTTQQAPTTGDDMIIGKEWTAAATGTARTVTMNETAATDYGAASTSLVTPSLAICNGGTLQYGASSSTNYVLRQSGNVIVYSGGTLSIGTAGTQIPRNSSAVLEFDCAADGDFGLSLRNGSTFNAQGLSRTSGKNVYVCLLNTDEAANSTSLGVDTDTGWLDNDEIAVASTSSTPGQCEKGTLNGNAGASTLTVDGFAGTGGGLLNAHSGTTLTQAEVVLLTRNVRVRSVSSTAMSFVNLTGGVVADIDWAEFYYLGVNSSGKRGFNITTATGDTPAANINIQFSSIHDTEHQGISVSGTWPASSTFVYSDMVHYNLNTGATSGFQASQFTANTTNSGVSVTITNCYFILYFTNIGTGNNTIGAIGLMSSIFNPTTCSGIYCVGHDASGAVNAALDIGNYDEATFNNITLHSSEGGVAVGYIGQGDQQRKTNITNLNIWRTNDGLIIGSNATLFASPETICPVTIKGGLLYDNQNQNVLIRSRMSYLSMTNVDLDAGSTFSTPFGIQNTFDDNQGIIILNNCDFGNTSAHATRDLHIGTASIFTLFQIDLFNCNLAASSEWETGSSFRIRSPGYIRSHKNDNSSTTFKTEYPNGLITQDTSNRHTASGYAWKLTPTLASGKLIFPGSTEFGTFKRFVASGQTITVTAYVQKDGSYNGNAPRLVMLAGTVAGISTEQTDSLTVGASTYEQLSVSGTASEDGFVEFYIDCDGTAGNVYVDDIDWAYS